MIETIWNKPDYGKDPLYHNLMPDNIRLNTPTWLYNMIMTTYPEGAKLLMSLNQSAMIDLRINTLKTTKKYVLDTFKAVGIEIIPTPFSAWGLRLPKRINLNTLDMYKAGLLEVQDEGSQILCQIINPQPNMTVVDYCAGAGGKSLTLAMLMNNKGKLILCDIALWRLEQATKRLRKAGVFNVQHKIVLDTPEGNTALTTLKNKADVVLVDAPCSGTGTWRRNPDARFRLSQNELDQLIYKQAAILEDAAKLVKKGGVLVYATCSILPIENQNQIQAFLNLHPEFTIQPLDFDGITYSMLQLYPHIHQTDGFFVARLLKH
jgi:16S rRNA (cytosine967-C5)-methyltransferase